MNENSNVIRPVIKPKEEKGLYKKHRYTVQYNTANRKWKWSVEHVNVTHFDGEADTLVAAHKAAKRHIDRFAGA